jgi:hypothetical protein
MLTLKQGLELTSVIFAFISGMTLYYAGLGVPDEDKSWKGQTPKERAIKRRQTVMAWLGIPAAVVALIAQIAVILKY